MEKLQIRFENQRKEFIELWERKRRLDEGQNIRWFTYVTIVFAPLSFAESFHSMGGAPDYALVVSLVKFCFAALAVTAAVILLTITAMPSLKRWKNAILGKDVSANKILETEDRGTSWDMVMLSVLRILVTGLLYPIAISRNGPFEMLGIGMFAFAFVMSVIFDIILVPIFILYWVATFFLLNFGDFYILLSKYTALVCRSPLRALVFHLLEAD